MVREIVEHRIEENEETIRQLRALQGRLKKALTMWRSMKNAEPTGTSVCHLIESFAETEEGT
jgi:hypothetical protein